MIKNGTHQVNLNRRRLEKLINWYEQRTNRSQNGGTTYEMTIKALELLRKADSGEGHPRFERPNLDGVEETAPINLSERQAQTLSLIHGQRALVNPTLAGNVKIIDGLIEIGALSAWRELTSEGKRALESFRKLADA